MADTSVQREVEDWIRREWMSKKFGQKFRPMSLRLSSGGIFEFDAVSEDQKIIASISTSGSKTAGGKHASGKLQKIRSDMFFLILVPNVERRVIVLTESDMVELCTKEREGGRIPSSIEFLHARISEDLMTRLRSARRAASKEVLPKS